MPKKYSNISAKKIERLSRRLSGVTGLDAAYIFGSTINACTVKQSDIDIAVLFSQKPDYESIRSLLAITQDTLMRDDIDLCILNDASPILAFEAIKGNRLLMKSPVRVTAFESLVARQYEDEITRLEYLLRTKDY